MRQMMLVACLVIGCGGSTGFRYAGDFADTQSIYCDGEPPTDTQQTVRVEQLSGTEIRLHVSDCALDFTTTGSTDENAARGAGFGLAAPAPCTDIDLTSGGLLFTAGPAMDTRINGKKHGTATNCQIWLRGGMH